MPLLHTTKDKSTAVIQIVKDFSQHVQTLLPEPSVPPGHYLVWLRSRSPSTDLADSTAKRMQVQSCAQQDSALYEASHATIPRAETGCSEMPVQQAPLRAKDGWTSSKDLQEHIQRYFHPSHAGLKTPTRRWLGVGGCSHRWFHF